MSVTIVLLRPFVLSMPAPNGGRLPIEQRFKPKQDKDGRWVPTEVEIPDEVAAHPYIAEHAADGAIESPAATRARKEAEEAQRAKQKEEDERILRQAEAAFKRAQGNANLRGKEAKEVEKALNTPINELKKQQGTGIDSKQPSEADLNTPVNVLQERQAQAQQS